MDFLFWRYLGFWSVVDCLGVDGDFWLRVDLFVLVVCVVLEVCWVGYCLGDMVLIMREFNVCWVGFEGIDIV